MKANHLLTVVLTCLSTIAVAQSGAEPRGAAETGNYRNLFQEAGCSPDEVKAKIEKAFKQLFHGDPKNEAVYFSVGENADGPLAQIRDIGSDDVRSEGMSYGMMIAVQLDKKAEFDALWNWARTYMYHRDPGHPARGFFSWSMKTDGTPNDVMPAPDGEEYFATALYFADARWKSGQGIYNYRAEADRLLTDMLRRERISGETPRGPMTAVSLFSSEHKMVRFTPDVANSEHTDPSYHLPAFYEVWARCGPPADREFWKQAAATSRDFFVRSAHPKTGLTPDYAEFDGSPWAAPWNPQSEHFQADAWRSAMNWSVDWAWWAQDPRQRELSDRTQAFFQSQGIDDYGNKYTLDGRQLSKDHSTGLVAANAVASLAATDPRSAQFVEAFWNAPIPTGKWRYYDGMLYLMGLLHCSGDFRVWMPQ